MLRCLQDQSIDESSLACANKKVVQLIREENFQSWKQHVFLFVRGYKLEQHIHGITVPQFIQDEVGANVLNPAYSKYIQQDNSLAS